MVGSNECSASEIEQYPKVRMDLAPFPLLLETRPRDGQNDDTTERDMSR